jgi:hypothetical protein
LGSPVTADEVARDPGVVKDERISRIVYQGNMRTKTAVMDRLSGLKVGMRVAEVDVERIRRAFLDSDLFSEVGVSFEDGDSGAVVTVLVKENLGLVLIPYNVSFNEAYYGGGLMLTDVNFLGEQKVASIGAAVSNLGPAFLLSYQDPHFIDDNLVLTTYLTHGDLLREEVSMDGETFATFPYLFIVQGIRTYYAVTDHWHLLSEVKGMEILTGQSEAREYGLYRNSLIINPSVGIEFSGQSPFEYFLQGPWGVVQYSHGFSVYGLPPYDSVSAKGQWSLPAWFDGMAEVGFTAEYGDQTLLTMPRLSGRGFRTLPANSFSDKDVGTYAAYDWPMFHFTWGVAALGAFYEAGYYSTGLDGRPVTDFFQGPGFGVHLFLNKISKPVIGGDVSYNVSTRSWNINVNAGLSLN